MNILASYFEPFEERKVNQSKGLVRQLQSVTEQVLSVVELPVEWESCFMPLQKELSKIKERTLVLSFGEASRENLNFECIALNKKHSKAPDNKGVVCKNQKILKGGELALMSDWNIEKLDNLFQEKLLPIEMSYSAGTYVCNEVFYKSLRAQTQRVSAAFIHCPIDSQQVSLTKQAESIELVLQFLKENPDVCFRN